MKKQLTDQELDAFLKGKLQNLNSEVPTSFWNEIDAQINKPKQRAFRTNKMFAGIALSAVAIAAAAAVAYTVISTSQQNEEPIFESHHIAGKLTKSVADTVQQDSALQIENSQTLASTNKVILPIHSVKIANDFKDKAQSGNIQPFIAPKIMEADNEPEQILTLNKLISEAQAKQTNINSNISQTPLPEQLSLGSKAIDTTDIAEEQKPKAREVQNNAKDRRWRFAAYFTPSYSYRLLDDADKYYFDLIESSAFAWNASLEVSYQINSKISVASAIDAEQYSLKTQVYAPNAYLSISEEQTYIMGSYGYTPCGYTVIQNSNSNFTQSTSLYYLGIPLQVQYNVYKSFFVRAGLNYSLLLGTRTNSKLGNEELYTNAAYLRRNNFGLLLSAGKEISINDKLSIIIASQFRIRLQSIVDDEYFKSNPYMLGLNIGIRY